MADIPWAITIMVLFIACLCEASGDIKNKQ